MKQVQVIVADNAGDPDTQRICERYAERFPLDYVVETAPGKNAALNTALTYARGELLLFTDDDVQIPPDWLWETWSAASRWPAHMVFGGKVLPIWPSPCPAHLNDRQYLGVCFSVLDADSEEGPSFRFTPFGPNVAIRRQVFDAGVRFNPRIGPHRSSYIMGSETELVRRLKRQGYAPVYVPRSIVHHKVRPEQFEHRWLYGRAFRYGRLLEVRRQEEEGRGGWPALRRAPTLISSAVRAGIASVMRERKARFDQLMELAMTWGMIYQARQPSPVLQEMPTPPLYAASNRMRA